MRVKKGFTLIEIVVSLAIIGIMMIPLANSLIMSVKANKMGEIAQESKNISQEIVESLRSLGNVEAGTITAGSGDDTVEIVPMTDSVGGIIEGKYNIRGTIDDIEVMSGSTIEKTIKGGTIEYESDRYLEKEVGLVLYVYEDKIAYSYTNEAQGKKIIDHIKKIDRFIEIPPSTSSEDIKDNTVGDLNDGNKIKFNFVDRCADVTHNNCNMEFDDIKEGHKLCFNMLNTDVAIVVKDVRKKGGVTAKTIVEDEKVKGGLIGLEIKNERTSADSPNLYFLNNRFEEARADKDTTGENLTIGDSFDEDKFIGDKIKVTDNIKFIPINDVNNKGLYTITLKTNRNDIKEKTVSEFIVSN